MGRQKLRPETEKAYCLFTTKYKYILLALRILLCICIFNFFHVFHVVFSPSLLTKYFYIILQLYITPCMRWTPTVVAADNSHTHLNMICVRETIQKYHLYNNILNLNYVSTRWLHKNTFKCDEMNRILFCVGRCYLASFCTSR